MAILAVQPDTAVEFTPASQTVVQSVAQRGLLKWWSDPRRNGHLPSRADTKDEALLSRWPDMTLYEVQRGDAGLRYKCLSHGTRLREIDGGDLTGRYLDDFFPEPIKQGALAAYDATVSMRRPVYTVRNAIDARGVPVTFERIRVPLSDSDGQIDHVLTHVEIFCGDGNYQRDNLLLAGVSIRDYAMTAVLTS